MYCPVQEKFVLPEEIIRGYEIVPDQYILMSDEELESVSPERSRTIEIVDFIGMNEVDPIFYDRPYYLVPAKGGEKAYRLLAEVLHRTHKAGLAKFVLAEREYLVALTSRDGALVLTTLHYSDEILPAEGTPPKRGKTTTEGQSRVQKSVERMIAEFHPGKYANERRKKLLALLAAKAKERAPVEAPHAEEEAAEGPPDLVSALEESMRKIKESR